MGANIRLTSLSQFERLGFNAGIKCWCGRLVTVHPDYLYGVARRHGLASDQIAQIQFKLRCSTCGAVGRCRIGWSGEKPGHVTRPGTPRRLPPA